MSQDADATDMAIAITGSESIRLKISSSQGSLASTGSRLVAIRCAPSTPTQAAALIHEAHDARLNEKLEAGRRTQRSTLIYAISAALIFSAGTFAIGAKIGKAGSTTQNQKARA